MIKVSKTKAEGKFLYINIHGFEDELEWNLLYKKIRTLLEKRNERN